MRQHISYIFVNFWQKKTLKRKLRLVKNKCFLLHYKIIYQKLARARPMLSYIVGKLWKKSFQQKNPHIAATFMLGATFFWKKGKKILYFLKNRYIFSSKASGALQKQNLPLKYLYFPPKIIKIFLKNFHFWPPVKINSDPQLRPSHIN